MPPFADNDKTVFVARRDDGSIYGVWTVRQVEGQEELLHDDPEILAFRAAQERGPNTAAPMAERQRDDALDVLDTMIAKLPADQRAAFSIVRQLLEK